MTEPGTVFQERYRFEHESDPLQTFTCDCGGRVAVVVRTYTDLHSEGGIGSVQTSVRTGCHCTEEVDPFRVETGPVHKLTGTSGTPWRVERVYKPIYRIREDGK